MRTTYKKTLQKKTESKTKLEEKIKKIELLDSTATLSLPEESAVKFKNSSTLEVSLGKNKYPILGINIECFDNPKLNNEDKIKNFLIDNEKIEFFLERKSDIFYLNYEIKIEKERLVIYKILSFLKPRTFRLLRFSITWPDTLEAQKEVEPILKSIPKIIDDINFNASKTKYDELASLHYKLLNAKLVEHDFWNTIKLKIPIKWRVEKSKEHEFIKIYMDLPLKFYFLIERFFINLSEEQKIKENRADKIVESLLKKITSDVNISNAKLKKANENNYLFYFIASEKDFNDRSKVNNSKIWYRIKVLEDKIAIVSFVFELSSNIDLENELYLEKLNQIIVSSEFSV